MSGGLWFAICVPSEKYERERLERKDTSPGITEDRSKVTDSKVSDQDELTPPVQGEGRLDRTDSRKEEAETEKDDEVQHREEALEKLLIDALDELGIKDAVWTSDREGSFHQVYFPCYPGLHCDAVLTTLTTRGIGLCKGSSLGILPCSVFYRDDAMEEEAESAFGGTSSEDDKKSEEDTGSNLGKSKSDMKKTFKTFRGMQKKFLKSVTARLTIAQVVEGVRAGAELTFDYIMFVLLASLISALGLLENSSVAIVASMLISPLMGPILAGTFGAVIRDRKLRNLGIRTEAIGLLMCLGIGFIFGLIYMVANRGGEMGQWPTPEMTSRGQVRSLWVGVLIALPSGAGVALSVLAGNAGSLVGVAISASLLPPAVNAGLLWALAAIKSFHALGEDPVVVQVGDEYRTLRPSLAPPPNYRPAYYTELDRECAVLGVVSLVLTFLNIACILLIAVLVLKVKEVAPHTSPSQTSRFWKEDVKIARQYNRTSVATDADELGTQFLKEWAKLTGINESDITSDSEDARLTKLYTLQDLFQDAEADDVYQAVVSCVPGRPLSQNLAQRISGSSWTWEKPSKSSRPPSYSDVEKADYPHAKEKIKKGKQIRSLFLGVPPADGATNGKNFKPLDLSTDPDFQGVQLRHPQSSRRSRASRGSDIVRQSLVSTDRPYSLWPSQQRTSHYRPSSRLPAHLPDVMAPSHNGRVQSRFIPALHVLKETSF